MASISLYKKDTQPSQTCSESYTFMLLHCTGVFLCFWGVLTRLDNSYCLTVYIAKYSPVFRVQYFPDLTLERAEGIILPNIQVTYTSFFISTFAHRMRVLFYPYHWLLCHLELKGRWNCTNLNSK